MSDFDSLIQCDPVGPGTWAGQVDASWGQGRAIFGGVPSGAALEAMTELVGQRRALSLSTQFLAPLAPGDFTLEASVHRRGRALTSASASLLQKDLLLATFQASFGEPRTSQLEVPPAARPAAPAPETLGDMPYLQGVMPAFTRHFAYRWAADSTPFSGSDKAIVRGWVRHRTAARHGPAAVIGMLDSWPAPVLALASAPTPASTVSWTAQLVDVPQITPEGWWYFEADVVQSRQGYATTTGQLYAPDGHLAAHMHQLVAVFG